MKHRSVLGVEEAADFLGVSAYTLRDLARERRRPAAKVCRSWHFFREALQEYLQGSYGAENDDEEVFAEALSAVRRGLEEVRAGRYVTLSGDHEGKRP